jgi:S-adenosylmethionine:tRNA ribosyltransferase-isomerase
MEQFISKSDFFYDLPEHKIAFYPLPERDGSKLLVYRDGEITDSNFIELDQYLPEDSLLIFNETKVIPARLIFTSESGAQIEIFCLQKTQEVEHNSEVWLCYVGNAKKWKQDKLSLSNVFNELNAQIIGKSVDTFEVKFSWNSDKTFVDLLDIFGSTPLPPYIKRKAEEIDKKSYQTVFSKHKGSVAAPTASLHFTEKVLKKLAEKSIESLKVTLHVGAGTFKPIKSENVLEHKMHEEYFEVSLESIAYLAALPKKKIIPVGTTALRTMETLYWLGVKAFIKNLKIESSLFFAQFEYMNLPQDISFSDSMSALYDFMQKENMASISGNTQIMITPDYKIKSSIAIVTNFHQPESTLLLLISAFVGAKWKAIYNHALLNNYRFLSYGDSSLLFFH